MNIILPWWLRLLRGKCQIFRRPFSFPWEDQSDKTFGIRLQHAILLHISILIVFKSSRTLSYIVEGSVDENFKIGECMWWTSAIPFPTGRDYFKTHIAALYTSAQVTVAMKYFPRLRITFEKLSIYKIQIKMDYRVECSQSQGNTGLLSQTSFKTGHISKAPNTSDSVLLSERRQGQYWRISDSNHTKLSTELVAIQSQKCVAIGPTSRRILPDNISVSHMTKLSRVSRYFTDLWTFTPPEISLNMPRQRVWALQKRSYSFSKSTHISISTYVFRLRPLLLEQLVGKTT